MDITYTHSYTYTHAHTLTHTCSYTYTQTVTYLYTQSCDTEGPSNKAVVCMKWTQKVNRSRLISTLILAGTCLGDWLLREAKGVLSLMEGKERGKARMKSWAELKTGARPGAHSR